MNAVVKAMFSFNLKTSCAKHINANVAQQRFGQKFARLVCSNAKTFSTRHEEYSLEQIQIINFAAASCLFENLKDVVWHGTSWLDECKPFSARYGILTSKMKESVNSMFMDAEMLDAIEQLTQFMISCPQGYQNFEWSTRTKVNLIAIVPRVSQVVKK